MSPRLPLLVACATLAIAGLARGAESCCEKPVSRTAMLTGGKAAAATPAETCAECDDGGPAVSHRKMWPVLSLSLGGAAAAVGALYVRRSRRP